jgi:hypothetical protein
MQIGPHSLSLAVQLSSLLSSSSVKARALANFLIGRKVLIEANAPVDAVGGTPDFVIDIQVEAADHP